MSRKGCAALLASIAALVFCGIQFSVSASPSAHAAAKLKLTCDQMITEIDKTASRLAQQYNAKGSSIDFFGSFERCAKQGKRTRQGKGYMVDDAPIPGETDPNVSDYYYQWIQVVTRTKKGKLRSTVTDLKCNKSISTGGGNYAPGGPC